MRRHRIRSALATAGIAIALAAGAAFILAWLEFRDADEGHLFEGEGREYIDRTAWFIDHWLLYSLLSVPLFTLLAALWLTVILVRQARKQRSRPPDR